MKAKIHKDKRMVALYYRKLGMWEVYYMTLRGSVAKRESMVAFDPQFSKAVTTIRKQGKRIPASGWQSATLDAKGLTHYKQGATKVWLSATS